MKMESLFQDVVGVCNNYYRFMAEIVIYFNKYCR